VDIFSLWFEEGRGFESSIVGSKLQSPRPIIAHFGRFFTFWPFFPETFSFRTKTNLATLQMRYKMISRNIYRHCRETKHFGVVGNLN
jgi:hypothetical protein